MQKDYYSVLGISSTATVEEIKKAYRVNAIKYHPDKNFGDTEFAQKFIDVKEAYDRLINPDKRREFDFEYQEFFKKKETNPQANYQQRKQGEGKQKQAEEEFQYDPYKQFYSSYDRAQQETPKSEPQKAPWGENINGNYIFFALPKRIGKLIGGWSTLRATTKKITKGKLFISALLSCYISIPLFAAIGFAIWQHWYFNLNNKNATKEISIAYAVLIGLIVLVKYLSRLNEVSFYHANYFIGVNGFSIHNCAGDISNVYRNFEVNFNDVTDFVSVIIANKVNFQYSDTSYHFIWINATEGKVIYEKKGTHHSKEGNPEKVLYSDYWLNKEAEKYWTIYLLDNMERTLEQKGYLEFKLYFFEQKTYAPYIRLGIGFITFLLNGEETTYKFNEIKRLYTKGTDLYIEHKNYDKSLFFFKSGNKNFIPLLNLCNRDFFIKSVELLLGYSIA